MAGRIAFIVMMIGPLTALANPAQETAIDKLVSKHGVTADGPGVAVAIIEPGKPTVQKCYGLAHLNAVAPVTPQTNFELASLSKPFTAMAVLILHDRGLLSVDDDVRKYLPELPAYRPNKPILIRHLLTHTSGLPEYFDLDQPELPPGLKFWTNEDYVPAFAAQRKNHPLRFAPGGKHEYRNTNYMLLATIVARVSKKPFGRVLQEEIFGPLGMAHSFVYGHVRAAADHPEASKMGALAYGRAKGASSWQPTWGLPTLRHETMLQVGDGAIWTNLDALQRWDAGVRAKKLLKPETWRAALQPTKTTDGQTNNYGFGWVLYRDGDGELYGIGHDGAWGGFHTSYYWHLATNRSYVVLSNRDDFPMDQFGEELIGAADAKNPQKRQKK